MPLKISALVLTFNEEQNIERCLKSLDFCDEIVVLDSGSEDRTVELAKKYTDKVLLHEMEGFGSQRNWGISHCLNDWVFWLDADEQVGDELRTAISRLNPLPDINGYQINRKTFYLGRWIEHSGWYPQYVLRLFNRNHGRCRETEVHESITLQGRTSRIDKDILHYPYRNLTLHLRKIDKYTSLRAVEKYKEGRRFNLLKAVFAPSAEFLKKYFVKKGFLDRFPGFAIAMTSAFYTFLKQAKLFEYQFLTRKDHQ